MPEILDKLIDSDIIVLATPVYFYSMDAQLKTLIDRTTPRYKEMKNKDFSFILTLADNDKSAMDGTLVGLRCFTSLLPGANEKGIKYGVGMWDIGDAEKSPVMNEVYEMGRSV